jgi:hypothetical protein
MLKAAKEAKKRAAHPSSAARIVSPLVNGCAITIFFSFFGCREITF